MGHDYPSRRTVLQSLSAVGLLGLGSAELQTVEADDATAQADAAWSQFHADARHSGATDAEGPTADNLTPRWTAKARSESNPVLVDGTVYVTARNYAHAVDAATGERVWRHELNSVTFYTDLYPDNTPAVADGSMYVTSKGGVASLDTATGEQEWLVDHATNISPVVADGSVYVAPSELFSLAPSDGTEQWRFDPSGKIAGAPAVADGTVYIGTESGVYALAAETGDVQWQVSYPDVAIWGTPTVVDGTVYLIGGDDEPGGSSVIVTLDAETGDSQWDATIGEFLPPASGIDAISPAVAGGTVYATVNAVDSDGDPPSIVVAFDAETGEEQWRFGGDGRDVTTAPVIANDTLYVGGNGAEERDMLFAIDAATGTEVTRFWNNNRDEFFVGGEPSVSDGTVFVSSRIGGLITSVYAIEAGGEPPETPPDPVLSVIEDTTGACDPVEFEVSFPDHPTTDKTRFLYRWDFAGNDRQDLETGDGIAAWTYESGEYDVRVIVENQYGATKEAVETVTVQACEEESPTEPDEPDSGTPEETPTESDPDTGTETPSGGDSSGEDDC